MAALIQEIWLKSLQMSYLEKPTFLDLAEDLTQYLEAGGTIINLAHAGADPAVLVNNAVWPLTVQALTETAGSVALDNFLTQPSVVRDLEKKQFAYDKQRTDVERHRNAILKVARLRAAFNIGPSTHSTALPVITTTGAAQAGGRKALKFADIVTLAEAMDAAGVDPEDRVLVLSAEHHGDLQRENLTLYNQLMEKGKVNDTLGFTVLRNSDNPVYDSNTGGKAALGAAVNPGAQKWRASVAFQKASFGKVMGSAKMFSALNDPEYAGDIINFQQFFLALPLRSYGLAAIINGI